MTVHDFPATAARKAVTLTRVSSREQEEGHSIEAQNHRLVGYCQRRGLEVIKSFQITESSTRGDRAKFMEMIAYIKSQKQPIALVADKVDRVQRSFKEYPLLDSLIQEGRLELHFNTENYVIHKGSVSQERMMWSFGVIMAQGYTDSLRDNVRRSQDHMLREGMLPGVSPIGYLNVRDERGKATVIVDQLRAPLIRRMFEEFASGTYTLEHMREAVTSWGLRNKTKRGGELHRSHIHLILTNPFYSGVMVIKGKPHPHRYPAIVPRELFEQCAAVLAGWKKKPFKYGDKEFVFRGLLTCGHSGRTISSFTKKKTYLNGSTGEWTYLRSWDANGKLVYTPEEKVLEQAAAALAALHIPEVTQQAITDHLRRTEQAERSFVQRQGQELKNEHTRLQLRSDGLMDLLMDGAITRDDYDRRRCDIRARQADIELALAQQRDCDDGFKDSLLFLLDLCRNMTGIFQGSTTPEKRQFLNYVLLNLSLKDGTLCFDYRNPFAWFQNVEKKQNGRTERI